MVCYFYSEKNDQNCSHVSSPPAFGANRWQVHEQIYDQYGANIYIVCLLTAFFPSYGFDEQKLGRKCRPVRNGRGH